MAYVGNINHKGFIGNDTVVTNIIALIESNKSAAI